MFSQDARILQKANSVSFAMMPVTMNRFSEGPQSTPSLFVFGIGYVGLALAHSFRKLHTHNIHTMLLTSFELESNTLGSSLPQKTKVGRYAV